jgi:hypothetical protein
MKVTRIYFSIENEPQILLPIYLISEIQSKSRHIPTPLKRGGYNGFYVNKVPASSVGTI